MKDIKKLDSTDLSEKFGLGSELEYFIFKPQEYSPKFQYGLHRSEMYSIGIVISGQVKLKVGLETYDVQSPGLIAIAPDQIRHWISPDEHMQTISLFFLEDFVIAGLSNTMFIKELSFFKNTGYHYIRLNNAEFLSLKNLFSQIEQKSNSDISNKVSSIQALLRVLLYEIESFQDVQTRKNDIKYSRGQYLTERFKQLLVQDFMQHRDVDYYSKKLFVTSKHLSQVLKAQTGKTIRVLIDEIICLEAKVLLQTKDLNISEISETLNFANPSFFGKFFKRHTGFNPQQYRKANIH